MPALVDRILVKSGRRAFFVRAETIEWVEADGNYVHLHAGSQSHRVRATMSRFEIALDSARFVRIHKSAIVNLDRVHEFCPLDHGDVEVIMSDGTRLLMSRVNRERLAARGFRL